MEPEDNELHEYVKTYEEFKKNRQTKGMIPTEKQSKALIKGLQREVSKQKKQAEQLEKALSEKALKDIDTLDMKPQVKGQLKLSDIKMLVMNAYNKGSNDALTNSVRHVDTYADNAIKELLG